MTERLMMLWQWSSRIAADVERNRATLAAGGLAYFVALALAPTAVAFGWLAGLVLNPDQVSDTLQSLVDSTPAASDHVQSVITALAGLVASASDGGFKVTSLVSIAIAVYASSKVVQGVRQAMDTAFHVPVPRSGIVLRAVSAVITLVGLIIGVGVVIMLTVVPRVLDWLGLGAIRTTTGYWLVDWGIALLLLYLGIRLILRHAPNHGQHVPWTSVGVVVATGWIIGVTAGLGVYAHFSKTLGAAVLVFGSAAAVLLWLYLCFLGLLWGAAIESDRQRRVEVTGA